MVAPQANSDVAYREKCCGIFFLKNTLYIFNFILLLSGLGVTAVGVITFFATYRYVSLIGGQLDPLIICTYLLLGTGGAIIFFVFTIGCCGTCRKSRACLMLYSVLLLLVFLVEAGTGILAYIYEMTMQNQLSLQLQNSMQKYSEDVQSESTVDQLQATYKCCGERSFEDWKESSWYLSSSNMYNGSVPDSCCKTNLPGCGVNIHPSNINTNGCIYDLEDLVHVQLIIIGGVGLGLCILQLFGIIFACCLANKVQMWTEVWNGQEKLYYHWEKKWIRWINLSMTNRRVLTIGSDAILIQTPVNNVSLLGWYFLWTIIKYCFQCCLRIGFVLGLYLCLQFSSLFIEFSSVMT